jgi:hypothetical protein
MEPAPITSHHDAPTHSLAVPVASSMIAVRRCLRILFCLFRSVTLLFPSLLNLRSNTCVNMALTTPLPTTVTPMFSVFTPPAYCSTHWTYEVASRAVVSGGILLQNGLPDQNDEQCLPKNFVNWGRVAPTPQIFSPGACPYGYTTAINQYNGPTSTAVCCLR